jgi:hypothetical protein
MPPGSANSISFGPLEATQTPTEAEGRTGGIAEVPMEPKEEEVVGTTVRATATAFQGAVQCFATVRWSHPGCLAAVAIRCLNCYLIELSHYNSKAEADSNTSPGTTTKERSYSKSIAVAATGIANCDVEMAIAGTGLVRDFAIKFTPDLLTVIESFITIIIIVIK